MSSSALTSQCLSFCTVFFSTPLSEACSTKLWNKQWRFVQHKRPYRIFSLVNAFLVDWRKQYLSFAMPIGLVWDTKVRKQIYLSTGEKRKPKSSHIDFWTELKFQYTPLRNLFSPEKVEMIVVVKSEFYKFLFPANEMKKHKYSQTKHSFLLIKKNFLLPKREKNRIVYILLIFVSKLWTDANIFSIVFFQSFRWTDGSPLAITMWRYPHYVYTDGWRYHQRHEQTVLKRSAYFQLWTLSLPTANSKKHQFCSALYFISPYEFFWVKIHCDQQLGTQSLPHRHFICEKQLKTANYSSTAPSTQQKHCQERENVLVSSYCLMFKKTSGPLKMHKKQDKTEIPFYMKNNLINTYYFHILLSKLFKKPVILLTKHAENNSKNHTSFCLLRKKELSHPDIFKWDINKPSKLNRSTSEDTMKLVIKDARKEDLKCPDGSFQCGDKSCILSVFICNSITDCIDAKGEDNSTCFQMRTFLIFGRYLVAPSRNFFLTNLTWQIFHQITPANN